jgi:hypothetical protein
MPTAACGFVDLLTVSPPFPGTRSPVSRPNDHAVSLTVAVLRPFRNRHRSWGGECECTANLPAAWKRCLAVGQRRTQAPYLRRSSSAGMRFPLHTGPCPRLQLDLASRKFLPARAGCTRTYTTWPQHVRSGDSGNISVYIGCFWNRPAPFGRRQRGGTAGQESGEVSLGSTCPPRQPLALP